ncbi:MAG: Eco57I restriction-modification methylase domain-containing protein [Firmicutes bacterium]|nr:Eco57I restriction-modification methylase domain-containing protein [Bacillota bacterium]
MLTISQAEEILKKEYDQSNYLYLVDNELLPDFESATHIVQHSSSLFASVTQLGESRACDVSVFEVVLNAGVQNRRVAITQEMFKILRQHRINNAIVTFSNHDKKNYRFSLLTSKYEFDGDTVVKVLSNPRRYSYSLGYGTKTKTAYDFLLKKGKVSTLDELVARFSLEVVNKQFYSQIAERFTELVGGKRDNVAYKGLLNLHSVVDRNKYAEFAVRLIGRIVFCWFLREKKSDAGLPLMPDSVLSLNAIEENAEYYNTILAPLFFEVLNTVRNRRQGKFGVEDKFNQIPYLNGGLFSPHKPDDLYKYTASSESAAMGLVTIPNQWFKDFFAVLGEYNFTVDENTSYDVELSIDPEMLGRIFENLLAEINPETGESAKKSTGSFYTPRDIVDYMVDSSLLEYLKEKTDIDEEKLKTIISYARDNGDAALETAERKKIINALYTLTVLDPACGSGAFPIGMLQKVVYILQEVDPLCNLWFDKVCENVPMLVRREFEKKSFDYIRKLLVIQKTIFGVDIQPIAVEISRLRCFLSLIIEEKVDDAKDNRGVNPLPNLDFKFVIANTLIELEDGTETQVDGVKRTAVQATLFEVEDHISELKNVREEYFNADSGRRAELREEFGDIQKKMFQASLYKFQKMSGSDRYQRLSNWSPFKNEMTPWFDPEWMFGVQGGFDIVIGNPPYIKIQNIDKEQAKTLKKKYKSATGKFDIYVLFVERAVELAKEKGVCVYIQPHRFISADYGSGMRKWIYGAKALSKFIHFGVSQVFDNAITYTGVFFYKKESDKIQFAYAESSDLYSLAFQHKNYDELQEPWTFSASSHTVLDKIFNAPTKVARYI